ncbi:hypothetical protein FQA39_LY16955 [Lamprigera yunnana]|nr:hypothetical protein FQA39_LY16955 [Lamprigera yunnana]
MNAQHTLYFTHIFVLLTLMQNCTALNLTDFKIGVADPRAKNPTPLSNKTVQMIAKNQTDYVKQIVTSENEKKIADDATKEAILHDIYTNCRYLHLLLNDTSFKQKTKLHTVTPVATIEAVKSYVSSTTEHPPRKTIHMSSPNYFYMTHSFTSPNPINKHISRLPIKELEKLHKEKEFNNQNLPPNDVTQKKSRIKYVQYEPTILQKVVMDDGKVVYYPYNNPAISGYQLESHNNNNESDSRTPLYTSTTTQSAPLVPTYEIEYNNPKKPDNSYNNQMKFIIPVYSPPDNAVEVARYILNSPYQYYPKPSAQIPRSPYVPVYNMIRTITIPRYPLPIQNVEH